MAEKTKGKDVMIQFEERFENEASTQQLEPSFAESHPIVHQEPSFAEDQSNLSVITTDNSLQPTFHTCLDERGPDQSQYEDAQGDGMERMEQLASPEIRDNSPGANPEVVSDPGIKPDPLAVKRLRNFNKPGLKETGLFSKRVPKKHRQDVDEK